MSSITSPPKLSHKAQGALLVICFGLSLSYLSVAVRQPNSTSGSRWFGILSADPSPERAYLNPSLEILTSAQPLIDFGVVKFKGCDLAWRAQGMELVTYWQGADQAPLALHLRFVFPTTPTRLEVEQKLDTSLLFTALPDGFYTSEKHGETWLRVTEPLTGNLVQAQERIPLTMLNGWVKVCN